MIMAISVAMIGAMVLAVVGFDLIGLPQSTVSEEQLENKEIEGNDAVGDQEDTNNEIIYEEEYEAVDDFDEELYKTDMQGSVSVGVTFLNPIEEDNDYFNFGVSLNTHSVELDGYDLSQMTALYLGDGIEITEGIQWTMVEGGGHHISGMLKIERKEGETKLDYTDKESIRLEIKDLDGVASRVFEWEQELF